MSHDVALSVVLLTRNGAETIGAQLEALARQESTVAWELVVADNGSTDGTVDIVESFRDRLPVAGIADASAQPGTSFAANLAVWLTRGAALAFCHDDDEVGDGWLEAMARALSLHDVVGGRLEVDRLNDPWTIAFRGRPESDDLVYWDVPGYPPYAFGSALGTTREAFGRLGGFDEAMVPSSEDMDYCWRALAAGYELHFARDAVVHYRYRSTWSGIFRQARGYAVGNVRLYKKHRRLGLPAVRNPWRELLRRWLVLVKLTLLIRSRASLGRAIWTLGMRVGSLTESVRQRVLLP